MRTSEEYDRALEVVRSAIRRWGPLGLIEAGSPDSEYDHEAAMLVPRIARSRSPEEVQREVAAVFAESFSPTDLPPEACAQVGREIFDAFIASGLLTRGEG